MKQCKKEKAWGFSLQTGYNKQRRNYGGGGQQGQQRVSLQRILLPPLEGECVVLVIYGSR